MLRLLFAFFILTIIVSYVCAKPNTYNERVPRSAQLPEGVANVPKTIVQMATSLAQDFGNTVQSIGDAIKNAMPNGP
ncbi:hypothetical protein RN001_013185 [Aquatica leii]|uniref:Uncharacterized protein n=1 Tax=Aquatica leii TaxID=1421715 RepID=A0AAN7SNM3_9COLE|nr:hypothetical protein RN001_013185 [Aquatica leii]